jgi:RNA polymerase sigma-B factor
MTVIHFTPTVEQQRTSAALDDADRRAMDLTTTLKALPPTDTARAALRAEVIQAWLPMAQRLARRYAGRGEPFDDLFQVAVIGLITAVDRFDPRRGVEFAGYAIPTVIGEIKRYFRDRTWSIRVPRRLQDMRIAIKSASDILTQRLQRPPTVADVATFLDVTEEDVLEGLEGALAYHAISLSRPTTTDNAVEIGDTIGADDHGYERVDLHLALGPALASLDERTQRILVLRFYGNQTQRQIAAEIGTSQMHVSRLLAKALATLRVRLRPDT